MYSVRNVNMAFQLYIKRACIKPGKSAVMYVYVRGIHVSSFYDFSNRFWSCSDSVVCLVFPFIISTVPVFHLYRFLWYLKVNVESVHNC
jgi:hypothetical protein